MSLHKSASYSLEKRRGELPKPQRGARTVAIEFAVVWSMFMAYFGVLAVSRPAIAYFTCDQADILAPYIANSVPTIVMIVVGNLVPILAILATETANSRQRRKLQLSASDHDRAKKSERGSGGIGGGGGFQHYASHAINLFWLGQFTVVLITEVAKRWTGRLRPHFLDVCRPKPESIVCFNTTAGVQLHNWIYTGNDFCTGDPDKVDEARLSFPSGHASFTTYVSLYLIVYLEMRLFVNRLHFPKRLLQCLLLLVCTTVLLSRYSDYQHHATDILAGFLLGLAVVVCAAYVGSFIWFSDSRRPSHSLMCSPRQSCSSFDEDDSRQDSSQKLVF